MEAEKKDRSLGTIRKTMAAYTPDKCAALLHQEAFALDPTRIWRGGLGNHYLLITSWARQGFYDVDFGTGFPAHVTGIMPCTDGLILIIESGRPEKSWHDAGVTLSVNLDSEVMVKLVNNVELRKYRDVICN